MPSAHEASFGCVVHGACGDELVPGQLAYCTKMHQLSGIETQEDFGGALPRLSREETTVLSHMDVILVGLHHVEPAALWVRPAGEAQAALLSVPAHHLSSMPDWESILEERYNFLVDYVAVRKDASLLGRMHVAERFVASFRCLSEAEQVSALQRETRDSAGVVVATTLTPMLQVCAQFTEACPFAGIVQRQEDDLDAALQRAKRWREERAQNSSEMLRAPWQAIEERRLRVFPNFSREREDPHIPPVRFRPPRGLGTALCEQEVMLRRFCQEDDHTHDHELHAYLERAEKEFDTLGEQAKRVLVEQQVARRALQAAWVENSPLKRELELQRWDSLEVLLHIDQPRYAAPCPVLEALETGMLSEPSQALEERGLTDVYLLLCRRHQSDFDFFTPAVLRRFERDGKALTPVEQTKREVDSARDRKAEAWKLIAQRESFNDDDGSLRAAIRAAPPTFQTHGQESPAWDFVCSLRRLIAPGPRFEDGDEEALPQQASEFSCEKTLAHLHLNWTGDHAWDARDLAAVREAQRVGHPITMTGAEALTAWAYEELHFRHSRARDCMHPREHRHLVRWWRNPKAWTLFKKMFYAYSVAFLTCSVPVEFCVRDVYLPLPNEEPAYVSDSDAQVVHFDLIRSTTLREEAASHYINASENGLYVLEEEAVQAEHVLAKARLDARCYPLGARVEELRGLRGRLSAEQTEWVLKTFSSFVFSKIDAKTEAAAEVRDEKEEEAKEAEEAEKAERERADDAMSVDSDW